VFTSNYAGNHGAGLYCEGGAPLVRACRFTANDGGSGGGAYFLGGTPTVADCVFEGNVARGAGGGIATEGVAGIAVRRCTFAWNESGTGGGICLTTGPAVVTDCAVRDNEAPFGGGLVVMSAWDVSVSRCEVSSNESPVGGGIYVSDSSLSVSTCEISGNGSGVHVEGWLPAPVQAAANWWGDASGPHHPSLNPGGQGDSVSDDVEFEPWNATAGADVPRTPAAFRSVTPTPFSSSTTIAFSLDAPSPLTLVVLDVSGRLVATLLDAPATAGEHAVVWDGRDASGRGVASGVYFLRLETPRGPAAARAVVVR
jgi:predicted outer membrane repeat protein